MALCWSLLWLVAAAAAPTADNRTQGRLRTSSSAFASLLDEFSVLQSGEKGRLVTINFFYGTACSNCLNFLTKAILPLVDAGLPGDRVKLSVLPFIKLEEKLPVDIGTWDQYCAASDVCFYALHPLCALKMSVPGVAPVNSPELAKAVRFAECNQAKRLQSHPDSQMEVTEEMRSAEDYESRECAIKLGLPYDEPGGIKSCVDSKQALHLIHTPGFTKRMVAVEKLLKGAGEQEMPYLVMDGAMLRCDGSQVGVECNSMWSVEHGEQRLEQPGSLLHVVCSRLDPQPPACSGVSAKPVHVGPTPACENCAEVGTFHWQPTASPQTGLQAAGGLGAAAAGAVGASLVGWFAVRRSLRVRQQGMPEEAAPLAAE